MRRENNNNKYPFLTAVLISTLLLTTVGLVGKKNVYADYSVKLLKTPLLVVVFEGIGEGKYPWMVGDKALEVAKYTDESENLEDNTSQVVTYEEKDMETTKDKDRDKNSNAHESDGQKKDNSKKIVTETDKTTTDSDKKDEKRADNNSQKDQKTDQDKVNKKDKSEKDKNSNVKDNKEDSDKTEDSDETEDSPSNYKSGNEQDDSVKEVNENNSTETVDKNSIENDANENSESVGTKEDSNDTNSSENTSEEEAAPTYSYETVKKSYFDDALFIGDSRTVGLSEYSGWKNPTYYADEGMSIYDIFDRKLVKVDGQKTTIDKALEKKKFNKIYIMLGINELGRGTSEGFYEEYKKVIKKIQKLQPDAIIFVQAIMNVTKEKSDTDPIFNNKNIKDRNEHITVLANNKNIFYIDVNKVITDDTGGIPSKYTFDNIHLKAAYYEIWTDYLLKHGIIKKKD